jgi:hypothetical protein
MELAAQLPSTPLFFAGAVGGPASVFTLTPLRNAVALGAQDQLSSARQIYSRVFATGGWTGGFSTVGPASLQSIVLGPMYHFWAKLLGNNSAATMLVGFTETVITYGSQTRNAQLAYNATVCREKQVVPTGSLRPWGPGASFHVMRNVSSMFGLRVIAEPTQEALRAVHVWAGLSPPSSRLPGDFLACSFSSAVSTVPALLHYFAATSAEYAAASWEGRFAMARSFLARQYISGGSRLIVRDVALRTFYGASIWTSIGAIERICVNHWPL